MDQDNIKILHGQSKACLMFNALSSAYKNGDSIHVPYNISLAAMCYGQLECDI